MENSMPNFEKFSRRAKPIPTQPLVTLQKRGTFSLNRAAHEALGAPPFIELLYDREARIVGFRATDESDPDSYPLRKQQNSASYLVAGNAFCQFYGIDVGQTRRFSAKMIDGVLAVDLNSESRDATGPRTLKSREGASARSS